MRKINKAHFRILHSRKVKCSAHLLITEYENDSFHGDTIKAKVN